MQSHFKLSPLVIALSCTFVTTLQAAEPLDVRKTSIKNLQMQFNVQVPTIHSLSRPSVPIGKADKPGPNALSVVRTIKDKKENHVRMQQTYEGFEVYGGRIVLHQPKPGTAASNSEETMNGQVYQGLEQELGKAPNNFVQNAKQALEAFKATYAGKTIKEEEVKPLVYIDEENKAHWAYEISLLVEHEGALPERPRAIVDAFNYRPFIQWNDLRTRVPVNGTGYGGNPKIGLLHYNGDTLPLLKLSRDTIERRGTVQCFMENTDVKVIDMNAPGAAMKFPCRFTDNSKATVATGYRGDGYDIINEGYSPSNDALYAGQVIKHLYRDWFGVEVLLNRDDTPMQLVMRVHFEETPGQGYENAFWDKGKMTFGDGAIENYPLVSIGVAAHEISHGFTEQNAGFPYTGQPGGMDEAFSDMANLVADYYAFGTINWAIGGEVMKTSEALRYMDRPSKDGHSIDNAAQFKKRMDPHYSSGVYNRLFYLMSTQDQTWNPKRAFTIMVKANKDSWFSARTFDDASCGILDAAVDLNEPLDGIKKAMDMVGVKYQSCAQNDENS